MRERCLHSHFLRHLVGTCAVMACAAADGAYCHASATVSSDQTEVAVVPFPAIRRRASKRAQQTARADLKVPSLVLCWQKSDALSCRGFLHWQWPRLLPEPQSQGSHCLHLFFFAVPQTQKLSLLHTRQSRRRLCRPPSVRCAQVCWAGVSYGVRQHVTVVVDGIAPCSAATHRPWRGHSVPDAGAVPVNLTAVPVGAAT